MAQQCGGIQLDGRRNGNRPLARWRPGRIRTLLLYPIRPDSRREFRNRASLRGKPGAARVEIRLSDEPDQDVVAGVRAGGDGESAKLIQHREIDPRERPEQKHVGVHGLTVRPDVMRCREEHR